MANAGLSYTIHRTRTRPAADDAWDSPCWRAAATAHINFFRPEGSDHHPDARARVLYDEGGLYVCFRVIDRYVRCVTTEYQGPVYEDACVEMFIRPRPDTGYFNFEVNCGGALLLKYIEDPTPVGNGFAKSIDVPAELGSRIAIAHTLEGPIDPEIPERTEWSVSYFVPFDVMEAYTGPLGDPAGQTWRGNFYKCAETNSHPHWASWAPIGKKLNFHVPAHFAPFHFD